MAVDSYPKAIDALNSIQCAKVEKILVNTGTGSLKDKIDDSDVLLVESETKLLPGGTRNLGIVNSNAPIVSFLAADCLAAPGSIERRMSAHDEGYDLVSSCLRPTSDSLGSWASYIYIHQRRMPERNKVGGALFGVSYSRKIFDEIGLFDDTMRVSEDAEFNKRCQNYKALWSKDIITYHSYPDTLGAAAHDAGNRAVREMRHRKRGGLKQAGSEISKSMRLLFFGLTTKSIPKQARKAAFLIPLIGIFAAYRCCLAWRPKYNRQG